MRLAIYIFLWLLLSIKGFAQLESANWYFRTSAGIRYQGGQFIADTNQNDSTVFFAIGNSTYTSSHVSSMSDANGHLQFYGSSAALFNRNHQSMPNGLPLMDVGYTSFPNAKAAAAEESSIIIPRPNRPTQYYFIYLRTAASNYSDGIISGAFATLVDMELDNGFGDVVDSFKNVFITDSTEEKICATQHANGEDYWLMVCQGWTNNFHAFLITESGIASTPVTSSLGVVATQYNNMEGNLRFNHSGTMLAHLGSNRVELFDFDNATGQLSNLRTLFSFAGGYPPGLEFSPDDSKLYTGGPFQYDLSVPTQSAIQASELWLDNTISPPHMAGIQLGPDGKIYGNCYDGSTESEYMDVIHNPNALGLACGYQDSLIYLEGKKGQVSVPKFLSSYFTVNFYTDTVCIGDTAEFKINFTFIDSVLWNFGDPASGANNTDTAIAPTHVYNDTGSYTVTLIAENGVKTDTVIKTIHVLAPPEIDLGPDQDLCSTGNDTVVFSSGLHNNIWREGIYAWNNGSSDSTLVLTNNDITSSPLEIRLEFTNVCGTDADTALVYLSQPLTVNLASTQSCEDSVIVTASIDSNQSPIAVYWTNGSGDTVATQNTNALVSSVSTVIHRNDGLLQSRLVSIQNACGTFTDSAAITFLPQADGVLPGDSVYCSEIPFHVLNPQTDGVTYRWPDGSGGAQYLVENTEQVTLLSYSICDTLNDTFNVEFVPLPYTDLGIDTAICLDDEVSLYPTPNPTGQDLNFGWNDGSTDSILLISDTGMYSVTVTLKGCRITDSISIYQRGDCYDGCKPNLVNIITPNADGLNDAFGSRLDCPLEDYHLQIFNRWGQVVFESTEPNLSWDGYINGNAASDGTYFYVLSYTPLATNNALEYRGSVSLLR